MNKNPVCSGYYIVSELGFVLKSGFYKPPIDYANVDWLVNEVIKLENKMNFYTKKDVITTEEDKEDVKNNIICRFCEKENFSSKVRNHCHLTGNIRGPTHSK